MPKSDIIGYLLENRITEWTENHPDYETNARYPKRVLYELPAEKIFLRGFKRKELTELRDFLVEAGSVYSTGKPWNEVTATLPSEKYDRFVKLMSIYDWLPEKDTSKYVEFIYGFDEQREIKLRISKAD